MMVTVTAWTTQMKAIAPVQQQSLLALVVNALASKIFVTPNQTAKMEQMKPDVVRNAEAKKHELLTPSFKNYHFILFIFMNIQG